MKNNKPREEDGIDDMIEGIKRMIDSYGHPSICSDKSEFCEGFKQAVKGYNKVK